MTDAYSLLPGDGPLVVSVPHDGRELPAEIAARMTAAGHALDDTDWHVGRLYDFVTAGGATLLRARYSRYVVDLNRPADDGELYPGQLKTGLCPIASFAGDELYVGDGAPDAAERQRRVAAYWQPYHDAIAAAVAGARARHGFAVLWDAHSIPSRVPRLFAGELPALNLGTNDGRSAAQAVESAVANVLSDSDYTSIVNGRFRGGHITRRYGNPAERVHALQLEIAQRSYMNESTRLYDAPAAERLRATLQRLLDAAVAAAGAH